jgi:hypothetical protein
MRTHCENEVPHVFQLAVEIMLYDENKGILVFTWLLLVHRLNTRDMLRHELRRIHIVNFVL